MPADAATSSPSVSDLQRRNEELSAELRTRTPDYEEALRREAAIGEIIQVTNASAGDLAQVFDAILEKAMRLCQAAFGPKAWSSSFPTRAAINSCRRATPSVFSS
jgi:hypothetical protein